MPKIVVIFSAILKFAEFISDSGDASLSSVFTVSSCKQVFMNVSVYTYIYISVSINKMNVS